MVASHLLRLLLTFLAVEMHDRLPHDDDILAVHALHLAKLRHDLLVVDASVFLEARQNFHCQEICEHLINHDQLDNVFLSIISSASTSGLALANHRIVSTKHIFHTGGT